MIRNLMFALTLIAFMLAGCAAENENKSSKSEQVKPPVVKPLPPEVAPTPKPVFPEIAPSNHALGGWWLGAGDISNSTAWVSKCQEIVLGLVINTPTGEESARPSQVIFERLHYKCGDQELKWGRMVFDIDSNGQLMIKNDPVGTLTKSGFEVNVASEEIGIKLALEIKLINGRIEILEIYREEKKNLITIANGSLKRVVQE